MQGIVPASNDHEHGGIESVQGHVNGDAPVFRPLVVRNAGGLTGPEIYLIWHSVALEEDLLRNGFTGHILTEAGSVLLVGGAGLLIVEQVIEVRVHSFGSPFHTLVGG